MAEQPQQPILRSFLIPFAGGQIILPNISVVEVLPFATPLKVENAPLWVVGSMLWRAVNVPLVSPGRLFGQTNPKQSEFHVRITMVNALGNNPKLPYFGILGTDPPRPLNIKRRDISLDEGTEPLPMGALTWVYVNDQVAIIPDMDAIEAVLGSLMRPI